MYSGYLILHDIQDVIVVDHFGVIKAPSNPTQARRIGYNTIDDLYSRAIIYDNKASKNPRMDPAYKVFRDTSGKYRFSGSINQGFGENYGSYTGEKVPSLSESEWANAAMQIEYGDRQKPAERAWSEVPASEKYLTPQDFEADAVSSAPEWCQAPLAMLASANPAAEKVPGTTLK
jgi:hypothetical protein